MPNPRSRGGRRNFDRRRGGRQQRRDGAFGTDSVKNDIHIIAEASQASRPMGSLDRFQFPNASAFDNQVFNAFDSFEILSAFTTSTSVNTFFTIAPVANSFGNFSSMAFSFDQYRIKALEIMIVPVSNYNGNGALLGPGLTTTVLDYDDNSLLTTIPEAMSYSNQITTRTDEIQRRTFKPRVNAGLQNTGASIVAAASVEDQWIDIAQATIPHYGMKIACTTSSSASLAYSFIVRAHFQYRMTR